MNITLNQKNHGLWFEASDENGMTVTIDGKPGTELGEGQGMSPMQLVLSAVGGCSVFDVVTILKKQKQKLDNVQVQVSAERREEIPQVFTKIHIHFVLTGEFEQKKLQRALKLSVEKYCSVGHMLEKSVDITYDYEINNK
ncbi:MAG: OsmC family protein [bacterium]